MRNLLQFVLFAIIGLVAYNYFYGDEVEKARSEKVISGVKDVFGSIKELAVAEKEKFDAGAYDNVLDKIGHAFEDVQDQSAELGDDFKERLADLSEEQKALQDTIEQKQREGVWSKEAQDKVEEDFRKLIEKSEGLFKEMEK
ncbi:MAG: hypothetical protein AAF960_12240 [Bacteroidota bacterium]